jgi:hypothetical protein
MAASQLAVAHCFERASNFRKGDVSTKTYEIDPYPSENRDGDHVIAIGMSITIQICFL